MRASSIRFSIGPLLVNTDGSYGQQTVEGVLRLAQATLVLEWREHTFHYTSAWETLRSEPSQLSIPLSDLAAVELRRRWFRPWLLILQFHSLDALSAFPYTSGSALAINVHRTERIHAQSLTTALSEALADEALRQLQRHLSE